MYMVITLSMICTTNAAMGLTLASDAILGLYSLQNQIALSTNNIILLHLPHLQLYTLTIYENMMIARHINYFKKST